MIRNLLRGGLIATVAVLLATPAVRADFVGSFGINGNVPSIAPTTGLATASSFTVASMATNGVATGGFLGIPVSTTFTGGTFTMGSTSGFTFSNPTYGMFTQTNAAMLGPVGMSGNVVTSEVFTILGTYVGGPVGSTPVLASFVVSFTQNGGPGNSVSASGTVIIPPTVTPEPASVVMLGLALAGFGGVALRRRSNIQN